MNAWQGVAARLRMYCIFVLCGIVAVGPSGALASVVPLEEVSVIGGTADDYYTGSSKLKLKLVKSSDIGKTLVASAEISSTMALSGFAAGATGLAGLAYYERTGKDPVYAAANAVASAADAIFQPAYLAKSLGSLFTPESLNTAQEYFAAKASAVGAKLSDIIEYVNNSASDMYSALRNLIQSCTSYGSPVLSVGSIIDIGGVNYSVIDLYAHTYVRVDSLQAYLDSRVYTTTSVGYAFYSLTNSVHYITLAFTNPPVYVRNSFNQQYYAETYRVSPTSLPQTASQPSIDYSSLKSGLQNPSSDVSDDLRDVVAALPASQKMTASDPVTAGELASLLNQNAANVAQSVAEQLAGSSGLTATEIAALQAATDAAKAAADVAKAAADVAADAADDAATEDTTEEPPEESEPTYTPPSTWYTPTCNREDITSCIDYQQVIDATSSLKNTTIYQVPNLLLSCLGYVKGDGCEYPPKLEIDFHNAFSSEPISIDLTPFETVVAVLKFFFAVYFFIATYRLTMELFR